MERNFTEALGDLIRDEVARGNEVELGEIGLFRLEHRNQHQKQFEDGRVVMMPPRDEIVFIPEKNRE